MRQILSTGEDTLDMWKSSEDFGMVQFSKSDIDSYCEPQHKIFLSHSGVQKEFAWHLCEALQERGHNPFFDKLSSSLPKGERFSELILNAAKQCEMAVVVVSEEYFMSKWPMIELHAVVQAIRNKSNTKLKILPLFYGLSVHEFLDEKRQEKWFQRWEALAEDDPKERIKVSEWQDALDLLKSFNGISYNRDLQEIMTYQNEIVSRICCSVPPDIKWHDLHVQSKSNICKIEQIGHLQDYKADVVGVYGVGGIGKTTLCKVLCNEMLSKYEGKTCHVEFNSTNSSLLELLRTMVIELTSFNPEGLQQLGVGQCKDILWKRISSQRTFLAIDNVWNDSHSIKHAKMLLGAPFHKESLIIVTARSRSTLELLGIHGDACVEMPELGEADAMNLFLYHAAHGKQFAKEEDKRDILQCINRCYFDKGYEQGSHYHPLALEALGLQLGCLGHKPNEWVKHLPRVRDFSYFAGENPVFDILRSSFDQLPLSEQTLFLDVVSYKPCYVTSKYSFQVPGRELIEWLCLLYKQDDDQIKTRLDRLQGKGLLQDVDLSSGVIGLHDLYREFARLELQGKLDKSTDLEKRRWVYIWNNDLSELESTPSGGCWQKLIRFGIQQSEGSPPQHNPIRCLEGIEWQYCSNLELLELADLVWVRGTLNLKRLKCLRSLQFFNIEGLDRLEGLEELKNLTYFKWEHDRGYVTVEDCHTHIAGQFPASLRVLQIQVCVWLEPDVLARCNNLCKLTLSYIRADNLDFSNCSSLQSLTLRCVKLVSDALQHINDKLPKLQTLALHDVSGAEGGVLTFQDMKVLCLGLSTPAKDVVMDLPKLEKLQLKMQCPKKLIINSCNLKYVAFNLEVLEPSKVDLRSMVGLEELLCGATSFIALSDLVGKNLHHLKKIFLDIPCMAFGEDGRFLGVLKDISLHLPSFSKLHQCEKLKVLNIGPGLWYSMEIQVQALSLEERWPSVGTLILHMIPHDMESAITVLQMLLRSSVTSVTIFIHTSSPVTRELMIARIEEIASRQNIVPQILSWTKSLDFSYFSFQVF